jgi:hypothetical protein
MSSRRGLRVTVRPLDALPVAICRYLPSQMVEVRLSPPPETKGSFVRTQSVHFDLDAQSRISLIEILGPPQSKWDVRALEWPSEARVGTLEFLEPEQCEEEETESFATTSQRTMLRIVFIDRPVHQHVEIARNLVCGLDDRSELVQLWVAGIVDEARLTDT